jgi:hypothetical protein
MHIIERGLQEEAGLNSPYADQLLSYAPGLDSEQVAIMALICEKKDPSHAWIKKYAFTVLDAQDLMPSGIIRSRQVLAALALIADTK